jgi:hypothetical protein
MATTKDALHKISSHEKECAIRYQNIEKRLDEGSSKFKRLEALIWGIYPVLITCIIATRYI